MAENFGPILAKARVERGETLEQVSRVLHVRPRYLQALEEEDYAVLPSDVQGKGFLRMYADHLGLAGQPLLETWGKIHKRKAGDPLPAPVTMTTFAMAAFSNGRSPLRPQCRNLLRAADRNTGWLQ